MGSLRNPIGPLPSSIYWRRRAVALAIVVLLALLVLWAVNLGGNGGKSGDEGKGSQGDGPATSITPGPSASGPVNDQKPGGRDESGGGGSDSGSGSGSGSGGGSGAAGGDSDGSGGGSGSSGSVPGGPIGQGSGKNAVEASSSLPNCVSGKAELVLHSVKESYGPDTKPKFELTVKNAAGAACKVDLGQKATVLTITDTAGDDRVWASNDCPSGTAPALLKVPAESSVKRTIVWDRRASGPQCATPSSATVPAGKYLIEAKVPGLEAADTSFVLAKD